MPQKYWQDANKLLDKYLARLDTREVSEMASLAQGWKGVSKDINALIEKLAKEASIKELSENKLFHSELYKEFLKLSEDKVKKYSLYAEDIITENQKYFSKQGISIAQDQISLIKSSFYHINEDATNYMIGFTSKGERLYDLLYKSYPDTIDAIRKNLISAVALGQSPEITAKKITEYMNGNARRALTIARTEQMAVFNKSSYEQYKQSGVVRGWQWLSESDACDECLDLNGKEFSIDEIWAAPHPNCRCTSLPTI